MPAPPSAPKLWADGRLRLRLRRPDGTEAVASVDRPYALIGRSPTADLIVPGAAAGLMHVYLHLDRRGVFAVDLASRTGSRFDGVPAGARSAWLRPGLGLELAGHRVELLEAILDGGPAAFEADARRDLLAEADGLARLRLVPEGDPDRPLSLLSELSFLGSGRSCSVRCEGEGVAYVHAVLARSPGDAFVMNLAGPALTVGGAAAAPAARLRDGDRLALGRSRFVVRLRPPRRPSAAIPAPIVAEPAVPARISSETAVAWAAAPSPEPGEHPVSRALRAVRDGQDELKRTNDQMQQAIVAAVRQLYLEQSALFERHLERLDRLQHEVAELRDELRRRLGPEGAPPAVSSPAALILPSLPASDDLRDSSPPEPGRATSWLLDRVRELEAEVEQEARSGWRELFSRLGPPLRPRGDS